MKFVVKITKAGLIYIGMTIFIGVAAVNTGNSILYILLSIMLSMMAVSGFTSFLNLLGLEFEIADTSEIYAKREGFLKLKIKNKKQIPSFLLEIGISGQEKAFLGYLPRRYEKTLELTCKFEDRGWEKIESISCSSFFPVGFFSRTIIKKTNLRLLVYPCPIRWDLSLYESSLGRNLLMDKDEFKGLREYRNGDPIRLIHWISSAKIGKLIVVEYKGNHEPIVWLKINGNENGLEEHIGKLTFACNYLFKKGVSVGLKTPNIEISPKSTFDQRKKILSLLAVYGKED